MYRRTFLYGKVEISVDCAMMCSAVSSVESHSSVFCSGVFLCVVCCSFFGVGGRFSVVLSIVVNISDSFCFVSVTITFGYFSAKRLAIDRASPLLFLMLFKIAGRTMMCGVGNVIKLSGNRLISTSKSLIECLQIRVSKDSGKTVSGVIGKSEQSKEP